MAIKQEQLIKWDRQSQELVDMGDIPIDRFFALNMGFSLEPDDEEYYREEDCLEFVEDLF